MNHIKYSFYINIKHSIFALLVLVILSFTSCSISEKDKDSTGVTPIDSTWALPLKEGTLVPIRGDSFIFEPVLRNTDKILIMDLQNIMSLKNKITNYEKKIYNSTLYFNAEALKKFKEVNQIELRKIYGPNANIYFNIFSLTNSKFQLSFFELNQYSGFSSFINIDAMDNTNIELKDICKYSTDIGNCMSNSIYPFFFKKGEKINFQINVSIVTDESKSESFYSKRLDINYDPTN